MSAFGRYVRNSDHVIAHRSNAVTIENARRAVIARTMRDNAAAARMQAAAVVAAVLWFAVVVVVVVFAA